MAVAGSPTLHFATCERIEDKEGRMVDPMPSEFQLAVLTAYEWLSAMEQPVRIIELKARQVYGSTITCEICYHHSRRFRLNALVMADDVSRTGKLWSMLQRFASNDGFGALWGTKWSDNTESAKAEWKDNRGVIRSHVWGRETASDPKAGASGTWQVLWFSEAARYAKDGVAQDTLVIGNALNALPHAPNTVAFLESTAEGPSGYFVDVYSGAVTLADRMAGKIGNGWVKVFCAWHECADYALVLTSSNRSWFQDDDERFQRFRGRELAGQQLYQWSPEQIAWRRQKIIGDLGGDERLFDRDFPESEAVAFASSTKAALDPEGLAALELACRSRIPQQGVLTGQAGLSLIPTAPDQAVFHVWENPIEKARYLVTVDTKEDKLVESSDESDCNSVLVLRDECMDPKGIWRPLSIVARIIPDNRMDAVLLAGYVHELSLYYGGCVIAVEAGKGAGVIRDLVTNLSANVMLRPQFNKVRRKSPTEYGWVTSDPSRRIMISTLQDRVREQTIDIPCRHVVSELLTLVIDKDGKVRASGKNHDDDPMALAMGLVCIGQATPYIRRKVGASLPPDWRKWKSADAPRRVGAV